MTRGEYLTGIGFHPSDDAHVDEIRRRASALIDAIEKVPFATTFGAAPSEVMRLKALATTAAEEAAMWGVKAATKPRPD